ncbi:MAG: HAD family phosphatase [Planctomycetes bacterium]|nr:HAD family phosphatase [Planctomycetota bacterium]
MPKFFYFDIGNVLLHFDHRIAARQLAALFECDVERLWHLVFSSGSLNYQLDEGLLTTEGFYEALCGEFGRRPDFVQACLAASEIFELNHTMNAVVSKLSAAGHRLGLLSNTSDLHWQYFANGRYGLIPGVFDAHVLSYRLGLMKPGREIYLKAAEMAGVPPQEIFYVDDLLPNVEGAKAAGIDAVQYTTTEAYVKELRKRGVRFNY